MSLVSLPQPISESLAEFERLLAASDLNADQRAELTLALVEIPYKHVKFRAPEGGGLDGRTGPERRSLQYVVDAAYEHLARVQAGLSDDRS